MEISRSFEANELHEDQQHGEFHHLHVLHYHFCSLPALNIFKRCEVYKLYIVEAELSPEILRVYFNYPARLANENDTWQCDDLWQVDSAARRGHFQLAVPQVRAFGLDPSCQLSSDRLTLEVMLGPLARLQVGQRVSMHFGVLLAADVIVVEPTELSQLVSTRWRIVPLQPVLLSADAIQGCSTGSFSLAESTGFARRPWAPMPTQNAVVRCAGDRMAPGEPLREPPRALGSRLR